MFSGSKLLELLVAAVVAPPDAIPIEPIPVAAEVEGADAEEIEDAAECAADDALLNQSFRQRSAVAALRECLEVDEISMAAARADWLPQVITAVLIALSCTRHSQQTGIIEEEDGSQTITDVCEVLVMRLMDTTEWVGFPDYVGVVKPKWQHDSPRGPTTSLIVT